MTARQHVYALVPVKHLGAAKSRLSDVLSPSQRRDLCLAMLEDVLDGLEAVPSISDIGLYTSDPAVHEIAAGRGLETHGELEGESLCAGLDRVAASVRQRGFPTLLVIPQDVPNVDPSELEAVIREHGSLTLAGAPRGGTNLVVATPPDVIGFRFGPDSLILHRRAAMVAGVAPVLVAPPSLARDIDLPADLDWLADESPPCRAAAWAARLRSRETSPAGSSR